MGDVTNLTERRWNASDSTSDFSVVDMLRVAIAQIERGEIEPQHAVLCMGAVTGDMAVTTDWLQAGTFNPYEQYGLLERVKLGIAASAIPS